MREELRESQAKAGDVPRAFDVFLSHNGRDKPVVERIAERLKRRAARAVARRLASDAGRGAGRRGSREGSPRSRACAVFVGPQRPRALGSAGARRRARPRGEGPRVPALPGAAPGLPEPFDPSALPPFLRHADVGRLPRRARTTRARSRRLSARSRACRSGPTVPRRAAPTTSVPTAASRPSTRSTPSSSSAATATSSGCSRS